MKSKFVILSILLLVIMLLVIMFMISNYTNYENVTFTDHDNGKCVLYDGEEYLIDTFFDIHGLRSAPLEEYVELGWYYSFPFGTKFHSYNVEKPDYIFSSECDNHIYLKKGFNFESGVFGIEDTSYSIIFSDALTKVDLEYERSNMNNGLTSFVMRSEDHPLLSVTFQLYCDNELWYAVHRGSDNTWDEVFFVSDELLGIFEEVGIIE